VKLGYGWTWFRVEDIHVDGQLQNINQSPWYNLPTFKDLSSLWPNSFNYGFGMEFVFAKSYAPIPRGLDFGLSVEVSWSRYSLEQDLLAALIQADQLAGTHIESLTISRRTIFLGLTVSF